MTERSQIALVSKIETLPARVEAQRDRVAVIAKSYQLLSGKALVSADEGSIADALWHAPMAIVAHGTEADPIFFFGNRTALSLFEMDFASFTRLPSRLSAEPLQREERARLLARVGKAGIVNDYEGVRISAEGKRFRIWNASVWNLTDADGRPAGQAAAFSQWANLE